MIQIRLCHKPTVMMKKMTMTTSRETTTMVKAERTTPTLTIGMHFVRGEAERKLCFGTSMVICPKANSKP